MRKYNLYMNEICNVYYLIAKFKFNPFKYSYVIFYDFGTLFLFFALFFFPSLDCAILLYGSHFFRALFVLLFSSQNNVDEELYGEKNRRTSRK